MLDNKVETRHFSFEVRQAEGDGPTQLRGYPIVFNQWSDDLGGFREKILPEAVTDALKVSDIRALHNHDGNQLPLGRTPDTLRLTAKGKGVYAEIDLPDTQLGRDLPVSVARGDITDMSFAFTVAEDGEEWSERGGKINRVITRMGKVHDISTVPYAAYPQTQVAVRKMAEFRGAMHRLDSAISSNDKSVAKIVGAMPLTEPEVRDIVREEMEVSGKTITISAEETFGEDIKNAIRKVVEDIQDEERKNAAIREDKAAAIRQREKTIDRVDRNIQINEVLQRHREAYND